MAQRRPLWAEETSPPTSPPSYAHLRRLRDATNTADTTEDTPYGVTVGPTFPASPAKYHRHLLLNTTIPGTVEWFYWDATRAAGTGRWVAESTFEMLFTAGGAVLDAPLNFPSIGQSGNTLGYSAMGRPFVVVQSQGSQTASGGDSSLRFNLRSSLSGSPVSFIALGTGLTLQQRARDIYVPTLGDSELFWCEADGQTGAGCIARFICRRTETN